MFQVTTRSSRLNVRAGPAISYAIVGSRNNGDTVQVLETRGDWGRIGQGQWVHRDFLTSLGATASAADAGSARGQYSTRIPDEIINAHFAEIPTEQVLVTLLLYDFETEKSDILEQHDYALRRYICPQIAAGVCVWVGGKASRAGDDTGYDNPGLARGRAFRVSRRIEQIAPQVGRSRNSLVSYAFGTSRSVGTHNSAYDRSVLVVVSRLPTRRPPPPPPRQTPLPYSDRFRARVIFGYEGGEVYVAGVYRIEIDFDIRPPNPWPARYKLMGYVGGGIGSPISTAGPGPWNSFRAGRNCTPLDFEGRASIGGYGVFGAGGSTTFSMFPSHGPEITIPNFDTGISGSVGISRIYGPLERYA